MRQVVNGAKGGPMLGQPSCISDSIMDMDDIHEKPTGPRQQVERERRLRREIANSNERRRMQSINHGYNMLKSMLPSKDSAEKLSKAAILQHAAEYMGQLLDQNKQLMIQNSELKAMTTIRPDNTLPPLKRRKRDTESSDEGISMAYQSPRSTHDADLIDELRKDITELRVQLEREKQKRSILEQSYTYSLMAAQVAQQQQHVTSTGSTVSAHEHIQSANSVLLSPPQSRHGSTESIDNSVSGYEDSYSKAYQAESAILSSPPAPRKRSHDMEPTTYGKASSVASQNLSIIVEAINHLESDHKASLNDKDLDSGISHVDSSDDTKSECSRTETPQPPPAHQSTSLSALTHHHPSLYQAATAAYNPSPLSLVYRPTFINGLVSNMSNGNNGVIVSRHPTS